MDNPPPVQNLPPVWLVKGLNAFRNMLLDMNKKLFPGNVVLYEQFQHFWLLPSLYVVAKLNIAELLKKAPLSIEGLAVQTQSHAPSLYRIMRALSAEGIFKVKSDGKFALNNLARGLLDEPGSLRYMLLHHLGPVNWNLMSNLEYAVKTGNDAFADKYGKGIYDYLKDNPGESAIFDHSMSNLSDIGLSPIMNAYRFSKYKTIADIGGGEGFLLANIIRENPSVRGILFDTKETVQMAPALFEKYLVRDRVNIITGNFFKEIPSGADLYILKNIIHNWNDAQCIDLLKNIHSVMPPHAHVLIIEMIVNDDQRQELSKLLDIQMLATMPGGRERTRSEFENLLGQAGFTPARIYKTISPICLIEGQQCGYSHNPQSS
ncbi:MAG: hypothetical protein M0P58_09520 [Bacteroidales bacterium]|nr:hypothetical protein [Bacteroidales bacterium]